MDMKTVDMDKFAWGQISAMAGHASFEAVRKVIELAMAGEIAATVTGPINKKSINEAGHSLLRRHPSGKGGLGSKWGSKLP